MLPGDGIGPEMMGYVRQVFRYAGAPVDFEEICFDPNSEEETDFYDAITSIKRNGVAIKGALLFPVNCNQPKIILKCFSVKETLNRGRMYLARFLAMSN